MSDVERRELGRRAGDGDLEAARRLVRILERAADSKPGGLRVVRADGGPRVACDKCESRVPGEVCRACGGSGLMNESRVPSWSKYHVCGIFCDGQDGSGSQCATERRSRCGECGGAPVAKDPRAPRPYCQDHVPVTTEAGEPQFPVPNS